jgi:hypothetical protein
MIPIGALVDRSVPRIFSGPGSGYGDRSGYNTAFIGLEETMCKRFTLDLQCNRIPRIADSPHPAATSQ